MAAVGVSEEKGYAERLMQTIKEEEVALTEYRDYSDAGRPTAVGPVPGWRVQSEADPLGPRVSHPGGVRAAVAGRAERLVGITIEMAPTGLTSGAQFRALRMATLDGACGAVYANRPSRVARPRLNPREHLPEIGEVGASAKATQVAG
jgi:hypothetical protein